MHKFCMSKRIQFNSQVLYVLYMRNFIKIMIFSKIIRIAQTGTRRETKDRKKRPYLAGVNKRCTLGAFSYQLLAVVPSGMKTGVLDFHGLSLQSWGPHSQKHTYTYEHLNVQLTQVNIHGTLVQESSCVFSSITGSEKIKRHGQMSL